MITPENKKFAIIALVVLMVGFAFGRYTVPEKVRVETKVVTVEKKTTDQDKQVQADKNEHKSVTKTETKKPDGTVVIVTQTTDDTKSDAKTNVDTKTTDAISQTASQTKEVTRGSDKVTISVLVGPSLSFSSGIRPLVYGGHILKPILGPITVGVWGMSNATGGFSLGLNF